jgi:hypothetical protein
MVRGWGAGIRTPECLLQRQVPYRLATPQRKMLTECTAADNLFPYLTSSAHGYHPTIIAYCSYSMSDLSAFLLEHRQILLSGHFLGLALGLGGATVTDVLFFNFLKDFSITRKEADVMRVLSNIIVGGLVLLFLSGILLYLSDVPKYNASPAFTAKMLLVMIITLNGILMHKYVAPHMVHLSFTSKSASMEILHHRRRVAFAMGAVSFTSWYFVFFLSMLKRLLPGTIQIWQILLAYAGLTLIAVITSQCMERRIRAQSKHR